MSRLGTEETGLLHTRTHWRALVAPVLWFILLSSLLGAGLAVLPRYLPAQYVWIAQVVWGAVLAALLVWLVLLPVLRWATTTYTVTDRRIISRRGIISTSGHDLPLRRVNDVAYKRGLLDRVLGSGTIVLTTGAEAPVMLRDVPHVEQVHLLLNDVLYYDDEDELLD